MLQMKHADGIYILHNVFDFKNYIASFLNLKKKTALPLIKLKAVLPLSQCYNECRKPETHGFWSYRSKTENKALTLC